MELAFQLVEAIRKCTPKSGKYVKSYSVKYELMKNKLLDDFVAEYPLLDDASQDNDLSEEDVSSDEEDGSIDGSNRGRSGSLDVSMKSMSSMDVDDNDEVDKKMELVSLLWSIGFEFIKHFQNLIRSPGGKERVSIQKQIEGIVTSYHQVKNPILLFPSVRVAQHNYYICGFFCSAGAKEALRRTTQSDVGSCIKAIDKHFAIASDGAHVERRRCCKIETIVVEHLISLLVGHVNKITTLQLYGRPVVLQQLRDLFDMPGHVH